MSFTAGLSRIVGSARGARDKLQARLLEVVEIEVRVAERVDELAGLQAGHLRHHHRQQRVGRDVERHAEEDVGGALVELARQPALGDVELEQAVARRQRHLVDVGRVPRGDDQAARVRIAPDHRPPRWRSGRWCGRPAPATSATAGRRPGRGRRARRPIRPRCARRCRSGTRCWCRRRGTRAARGRSTSGAASWW